MHGTGRHPAGGQPEVAALLTRFLVVFSMTITLVVMGQAADRLSALLWPLPSSRTLTGGFADTRPDHFHGGVDIRAREPQPVIAPTDGWIERIAVNPSGYGRALYFRLADGRTAVFGHLSQFSPSIEEAMRDSQIVTGTYRMDVSYTEPRVELTFKRSATLAYTGQTGSGPPHLHFEIREGAVQTDPLASYAPVDRARPVIVNIWWTTLSDYLPTSAGTPLETPKNGGKWLTHRRQPIHTNQPVALCIQTYDPGPWGRHAVPTTIRLRANGQVLYEDFTGRIDLTKSKDFYETVLWSERKQFNRDVRRLFAPPPPQQYALTASSKVGWLTNLSDTEVTVEVEDRAGNVTTASIPITCGNFDGAATLPPPTALQTGAFTLSNSDCSLAWATLSQISPSEVVVSPADIGFSRPCTLSYCYTPGARAGLFFYERTAAANFRPLWPIASPDNSEYMACEILCGGNYGVAMDTTAPVLQLSLLRGTIRFRLTDGSSWVDDRTIRCRVDSLTAIAEFEYQERGGVIWTQNPLTRGPHEVQLTAGDRAGNILTWHSTVHIP